jgi:parallel beta-helix repeat protein
MKIARQLRQLSSVIGGVVLLGGLLGAAAVDAATYYTATTGSDANPGTATAPFRTVAKGVSPLRPGDTLLIKSGTYAEALNNKIPGGTSWSAPVTVAAYPGHTVTLRPPINSGYVLMFSHAARQYIVVDGLILDAINVTKGVVYIGTSAGGTSHHIRLKNSEVKNAQLTNTNADPTTPHGQGIFVDAGADGNEFINLKVHDNGASDFDHGFYIRSSSNLIERCQVYRNAGWGLNIFSTTGTHVNNNIIRNNKIYDNARVGPRGDGIVVSSGNGNLVYNNLIWGNKKGIQVTRASHTKVYNNTVYANQTTGILISSSTYNSRIQNNIVYGNAQAIRNDGTGTLLAQNLTVDPKFVNATAKDLRLQSSSPAINHGVPLSEVPNDYAGLARPQGGSYDIGGYEYTGSTVSALVPAPMHLRITDAE